MEEKGKEWCGKVRRSVDVEVDAMWDRADRWDCRARYGEEMVFINVPGYFQVIRDVEERRERMRKVSRDQKRSQNAK